MTTHATPFTRRGLPALTLAVAIAPLAGCINDGNSRLTIGPEDAPSVALTVFDPYVTPPELAALAYAEPAIATHHAEPPTVVGLNRDNWAPQAFLVPVDTVLHAPHYRWPFGTPSFTARERGEYPTTADALLPYALHPDREWREAPEGPGWGLIEAVAMPVRVFLSPPCVTRHSPTSYARTPDRLHTAVYSPIPEQELTTPPEPAGQAGSARDVPDTDRFVPIEPRPAGRVQPRAIDRVEPVPTEPATPPVPEIEPEPATPDAGGAS